jgi:hypothetical protein
MPDRSDQPFGEAGDWLLKIQNRDVAREIPCSLVQVVSIAPAP